MSETKKQEIDVIKSDFYQEILQHKKIAESQFVLSIYKNPDYFYEYELDPSDISDNAWKVYYGIVKDLLEHKQLRVVDMIAVEEYIQSKSKKLQEYYVNNGGYNTVEQGMNLIQDENIGTFYSDIQRYAVILKLIRMGYPIRQQWSKFSHMSLQDLSDYLEGQLSSAFLSADIGDDKVEDIGSGIEEMVERADSGIDRGLPLQSQLLNEIQNGMSLGNITLLAAGSGVGKTFLTFNQLFPTHVEFEEPLLIIANEEDKKKWQQDIIVWHINNNQKNVKFNKSRFHQGNFSEDEKKQIKLAIKWLKEKVAKGLIQFVNLQQFSMSRAIKLIKKYATGLNVKYFVIDTLKADNDAGAKATDKVWFELQQNMVKLYNVIKEKNKNCHVWVTYQMNKSIKGKYLSQNDLGMSRNVADVVSSLILVRMLSESEKGEGSGALKVKRSDGRRAILDPDKDYFVCFWDKNRQGNTSEQAVICVDRGRNKIRDVGRVRISPEYS